jgi:creatinine amidohydrolase
MEVAMGAIYLDHLSWTDIKSEIDGGRTTVVVGFGATEEHGPHLPIGTDSFLGDAVVWSVAEKLDAFVAPTLRIGCSVYEMSFPGTISLRAETLHAITADVVKSLTIHGFKRIILVPTHGGNCKPISDYMESHQPIDGVDVIAFTDLRKILEMVAHDSSEMGISPAAAGSHAGEWETSLMLHLKPELVHMERAIEGYMGELPDFEVKPFPPLEDLHSSGIVGDARSARREAGEYYLRGWIDLVLKTITGK